MTGILRNLLYHSSSGTVGVHVNLSLYVYPASLLGIIVLTDQAIDSALFLCAQVVVNSSSTIYR